MELLLAPILLLGFTYGAIRILEAAAICLRQPPPLTANHSQ